MLHGMTDMSWTPPDAPRARAEREYTALFRIHQRHANDAARRDRGRHLPVIGPGEAVRLVVGLAAGGLVAEDGEDAVGTADLTAALTLMPMVRAEIDQLESSLLMIARGRGMTWQEMAFWLGLGSAQAARQRYERLTRRTAPGHAPADRSTGTDDLLRRTLLAAVTDAPSPGPWRAGARGVSQPIWRQRAVFSFDLANTGGGLSSGLARMW
jgi:hypothetical protein